MEKIDPEWIREQVVIGRKTHREISEALKVRLGINRGLRECSVRRFCKNYGIHYRSGLDGTALASAMLGAIQKVGPTWGRKMLKGYFWKQGVNICSKHIGASLASVAPVYHQERLTTTERATNPLPYYAQYFGHKIHMDQNEKIAMYGVTHVCGTDGYSGRVVSHALMPVKNNLLIYEHVFRPAVLLHGVWDQVRVDTGAEFYLTLFVQDILSPHRQNTSRAPYVQTNSKQNHAAERIWVEMNGRVNYPLKRILNALVNDENIDIDCRVPSVVDAWNKALEFARSTTLKH